MAARETAKFSRKISKILVSLLLNLSSPPKTETKPGWVFLCHPRLKARWSVQSQCELVGDRSGGKVFVRSQITFQHLELKLGFEVLQKTGTEDSDTNLKFTTHEK